jgi:hypothetical protein
MGTKVLISSWAWGLGNSPNRVGVQGPGLPGPLHGVGPQKGCHSIEQLHAMNTCVGVSQDCPISSLFACPVELRLSCISFVMGRK